MKRSELLSSAIGLLEEELIKDADLIRTEEPKAKGRKSMMRIITAAACIALTAVSAAVYSGTHSPLPDGGSSGGTLSAIKSPGVIKAAAAVYPLAASYPDEGACIGRDGSMDTDAFDAMFTPWAEDRKKRIEHMNRLDSAEDFYRVTAENILSGDDTENRVCSPVNIYMALSMISECTSGESRSHILSLLGAESMDKLRENAFSMWNANYRNDGATLSIAANSLWLDSSVSFNEETVKEIAENYYASVFCGDMDSPEMTAALRQWLDDQTGGLLSDKISNVSLDPGTAADICSAFYFRAKWDDEFSPELNDTKPFHTKAGDVNAEFMNGRNNYGTYYAGEDYGAIALDFADGGSMWFILPDSGKTVEDVLKAGEYLKMAADPFYFENKKTLIVNYSVPKFDISSQRELSESLEKMGLTDVFDPDRADFSPLAGEGSGVYLNKVKHAARVKIDEEGCTAAAFTEMSMAGAALPPEEEMDIVFDRPFIFAVYSDTMQPLFIGTVNDPSA